MGKKPIKDSTKRSGRYKKPVSKKRRARPSAASSKDNEIRGHTAKKINAAYASKRRILKVYVNELKRNGKCAICGESDFACLDFHHNGSKLDNISDMIRRVVPLSVLKTEINKCMLVCANCHRKIHYYSARLNTNENKK